MRKRVLLTSLVILLVILVVPTRAHVVTPSESDTNPTTFNYQSSNPIIITSDSDFDLLGFPGNGTQEDPFLIEGLNISSFTQTILVSNTSVFFEIRACLLTHIGDLTQNVVFDHVRNGAIRDSYVLGGDSGVFLRYAIGVVVENTTICGASIGVDLLDSSFCSIFNNMVHSCNSGITIDSSLNCTVAGNMVYENLLFGIVISFSAANNFVFNNTFGHNGFLENPDILTSEAMDYSFSTAWDNGVDRGNNWTRYDGNGTYVVPVNGAVDNYPSVFNYTKAPSIVGSPNMVYVEGTTGHELQWNASDLFPTRYEFYINEELNESGWWTGTTFNFIIDGLPTDVYNVTLAVYNIYGNRSRDLVVVNVLEDLFGGVGTEYVLLASLISVILVAVVIIAMKKYL